MKHELNKAIEDLKSSVIGKIAEIDGVTLKNTADLDEVKAKLAELPAQVRADFESYIEVLSKGELAWTLKAEGLPKWHDLAGIETKEETAASPIFRPSGPGVAFRKTFPAPLTRSKAALTAIPAEGRGTEPGRLWAAGYAPDVWQAAGAMQIEPTEGKWQSVETTGIAFSAGGEGSRDATSFDATQGAIAATERDLNTHVVRCIVPFELQQDVPMISTQIEALILRAYAERRGVATTSVVENGVLPANQVPSGAAATGLTDANVISKLLSLATVAGIPKHWLSPGTSWVVSPKTWTTLAEKLLGSGGVSMAPGAGLTGFAGWPLFADPSAADLVDDKLIDFFGDMEAAVYQAQRGRLIIDRSVAAIPGALAIFSAFRFGAALIDEAAIAAIKVGAN